MAKPLSDAVADFLGPIMAEYCRLIDEGSPDMPVVISFGGAKHETTLAAFKKLDRAHNAAFERNLRAAQSRRARKAAGSLI